MTHRPLVSFAIAENQITIRKVRRLSLTIPNSRIRANSGASMSPRWRRPCIWCAFGHDVYDPLKNSWKTALEWSVLSGKQKHRTSSMKTSVLLEQNIRTLYQRSPMFYYFRTTTSLSSTKKVFENLLHFLHHGTRCPVFTDNFGWRIGCRILV